MSCGLHPQWLHDAADCPMCKPEPTLKSKKFFGYLSNGCKVGLDSDIEGVGDEYHTLHELYEHRLALNIALFHSLDVLHGITSIRVPRVYKSKNHHPTSDPMFEDYFIVFCIEPKSLAWTSYHYKLKHWDEFRIPIAEFSPPYPLNHVDSITFFKNICWRDA